MSGVVTTGTVSGTAGTDLILKADNPKQVILGTVGQLYKWPISMGATGNVLITDGANNLSFTSTATLRPSSRVRNWTHVAVTGSASIAGIVPKKITSFSFDGTNAGDSFNTATVVIVVLSLGTIGTGNIIIRNTGSGLGVASPYTINIQGIPIGTDGQYSKVVGATSVDFSGNIPTGASIFEICASSSDNNCKYVIGNIILPN